MFLELEPGPVNQGQSRYESSYQHIPIDRRTPVFNAGFAEDSAYIGRHQSTPEDVNNLPRYF